MRAYGAAAMGTGPSPARTRRPASVRVIRGAAGLSPARARWARPPPGALKAYEVNVSPEAELLRR